MNFFKEFLWSPVSRILPKNVKEGPLGVFEHQFFCKIEKNEGDPLKTLKKYTKKSLTKSKKTCTEKFGQGRDSNLLPSAWQTSKKL